MTVAFKIEYRIYHVFKDTRTGNSTLLCDMSDYKYRDA